MTESASDAVTELLERLEAEAGQPSLLYMIGRINQGVRRELNTRLAGSVLSIPEYTTLSVLRARPGLSNAQLSRRALVAPQSMFEILAKLESRKLVVRSVDPTNRRIRRACLTAAGLGILAEADAAVTDFQEVLLTAVSEKDRVSLANSLATLMTALRSGLPSDEKGGS